MADKAVSDHPGVQRQLDRIGLLAPDRDVLGLERIQALLERLGRPDRQLPPVLHVAGTNGKGSTCAFLRAALEASGLKVHLYSSPHLVRFNERIRLAGRLIDDERLAAVLEEVLDAAGGIEPTFFEATTAAALLAFAREPADACVLEVGLGGRLDATNVIEAPLVCGIAQLGIDHQAFLGKTAESIAAEKAGIAKPGVPLVTQRYPVRVANRIAAIAEERGAHWMPRGSSWDATVQQKKLHYRDRAGRLELPLPRLPGAHQAMNAGLAIAMLRHQSALPVPASALRAGLGWAEWPARIQRLGQGPLLSILPHGSELWLDGGHNPSAARVVADHFRGHVPAGRDFHMILGLLENKDAVGVLKPFRNRSVTVHPVPVPDHPHHSPERLGTIAREAGLTAVPSGGIEEALSWIARHADRQVPPIVLILGSLYLAGEVLAKNRQPPV